MDTQPEGSSEQKELSHENTKGTKQKKDKKEELANSEEKTRNVRRIDTN